MYTYEIRFNCVNNFVAIIRCNKYKVDGDNLIAEDGYNHTLGCYFDKYVRPLENTKAVCIMTLDS